MEIDFEFSCPYCGETNLVELDDWHPGERRLVEDCQICCRPCNLRVTVQAEDNIEILVQAES